MNTTHEAWNAGLSAQLKELRIDVPEPDVRTDRAINAVRRFGFALISGLGKADLRAAAAVAILARRVQCAVCRRQQRRGHFQKHAREN